MPNLALNDLERLAASYFPGPGPEVSTGGRLDLPNEYLILGDFKSLMS